MSQHAFRAPDFIEHMLKAVGRIQTYMQGKSEEEFLTNEFLQDAVVRNFENLGEAAKNFIKVLPDAKTRFPNIPFSAVYAVRNQLSHGYFSVEYNRLWTVIQNQLEPLKISLEDALNELNTLRS